MTTDVDDNIYFTCQSDIWLDSVIECAVSHADNWPRGMKQEMKRSQRPESPISQSIPSVSNSWLNISSSFQWIQHDLNVDSPQKS